jgi:hypothetical protein
MPITLDAPPTQIPKTDTVFTVYKKKPRNKKLLVYAKNNTKIWYGVEK